MTSRCGAGAHAPSGPPWMSTTVGRAAVAGAGRRRDPGVDRTAGPGRLDEAHVGHRSNASCQREPSRRAASARWTRRAVWPTSTVISSIARMPSVPERRRPAPFARHADRVGRDVGPPASRRRSRGRAAGRSRVDPERVRMGPARGPRSSRRSRSSSSQTGPWRPDTIQPLRSVSAQLPIGRSRSGREVAVAGASRRPVPTRMPGLMSSSGSGSSDADGREPAPVRRPGGVVRPAAWGEDLARLRLAAASTSTAQIVVRGCRSGSGPRSAVNATVLPSGCQAMSATPQSPRVTWRGRRARARR